MAGWYDNFRRLWGWMSSSTTVTVVNGPKVTDRVNFKTPTDRVDFTEG